MADRKQFIEDLPVDPRLMSLFEESQRIPVSEAELHEQRISFAYGNALEREDITKDSVRETSQRIRLRA